MHIPSNEILGFTAEIDVIREVKVLLPLHYLLICVVSGVRTKWWISDETFEHDGTKRPPVTFISVPFLEEYLRGDIVWRADSGISL